MFQSLQFITTDVYVWKSQPGFSCGYKPYNRLCNAAIDPGNGAQRRAHYFAGKRSQTSIEFLCVCVCMFSHFFSGNLKSS